MNITDKIKHHTNFATALYEAADAINNCLEKHGLHDYVSFILQKDCSVCIVKYAVLHSLVIPDGYVFEKFINSPIKIEPYWDVDTLVCTICRECLKLAEKTIDSRSIPDIEKFKAIFNPPPKYAAPKDDHQAILDELHKLYTDKNHDYGDSFHQMWSEEGIAMLRIRLGDKFNRFKTLSQGELSKVKDESIRDTLMDMANYIIMGVMELDREKEV